MIKGLYFLKKRRQTNVLHHLDNEASSNLKENEYSEIKSICLFRTEKNTRNNELKQPNAISSPTSATAQISKSIYT